MDRSPFYLIVHKESVEGAMKDHPGSAYVASVLAELENVMKEVPQEDLGRVYEDMGNLFLDKPGNEERIGGRDRKIIVCGGFYSKDDDPWCVNVEIWDLRRRGYENVEICEPATLVRETLWKGLGR
jgi:hypothetical protein